MPIHGEQIELNPAFVACFIHEILYDQLNKHLLFSLLYSCCCIDQVNSCSNCVALYLQDYSYQKAETLAVHSFVIIDKREAGIQGMCDFAQWVTFYSLAMI